MRVDQRQAWIIQCPLANPLANPLGPDSMQPSERSDLRDPTERFVAELTDIIASLNSDHE